MNLTYPSITNIDLIVATRFEVKPENSALATNGKAGKLNSKNKTGCLEYQSS